MSLLRLSHGMNAGTSRPNGRQLAAAAGARGAQRRIRLRTPEEIRCLPDPEWLVEDVLVEGTFGALYGRHASFKSFVSLSLAFSIATGQPCAGRAVRSGPVVYLAGEGSAGLKHRMAAWEQHHGTPFNDIWFSTSPISFLDPAAVAEFIEVIRELPAPPVLIVIDTLARCFGGGDENSTRDMNAFVSAVDQVREAAGCAILVVHHTPHAGGKLRGSSALPGALDTIIAVEREERRVTLKCEKQKDASEFTPIRFTAATVAIDDRISSLVLQLDGNVPTTESAVARGDEAEAWGTERERALVEILEVFGSYGASAGQWLEACDAIDVPRATFFRIRRRLLETGRVEKVDLDGKPRYRVVAAETPTERDEPLSHGGRDDEDEDDDDQL